MRLPVRHISVSSTQPGAFVAFPYDRATVEQFRESFPRARWDDERRSWFVPGKTADQRIARWIDRQTSGLDAFADDKGRDAYDFEPIVSQYLEVADDLRVRTPYSKTAIQELRQVPWAHWDETHRLWRVPFRSYEDLRRRWPIIEAAAQRNEPEVRRMRRMTMHGSEDERRARMLASERRRRRYPIPSVFPPPLGRPVSTERYGIVLFTDLSGELVTTDFSSFYPHLANSLMDFIWASWRLPSLKELVSTWPARSEPDRRLGWWLPTLAELRLARKLARSRERRRSTAPLGRSHQPRHS
ncbi:hypothetical protein [Mycoplana dimorpha]|nr:hypothetical protein [Mycoplana dimorpha]